MTLFGIGITPMNTTLKINLGNQEIAPYDFNISSLVLGAVYPNLYGDILRATDTLEILPGIVESWSFDHKDTFTLKVGEHFFHNGRAVTASDLEFSIIRGFISNSANYNSNFFRDIAGVEKLKKGTKFSPGMVDGIKVTDEKTIKIRIKTANPLFLVNFTIPLTPIVPAENLKDDYYSWKTFPIGAGPYKISEDYHDHRLTLIKIDRNKKGPEKIEYHTRRKDVEYDIMFDGIELNEQEKTFKKNLGKFPTGITSLYFYKKNKFGQNENFRKAIYHSINRIEVLSGSEFQKPAYTMTLNTHSLKKHENPFNLEMAKEYAKKTTKRIF
jgi:ABC-type transport system substrate-binding protein